MSQTVAAKAALASIDKKINDLIDDTVKTPADKLAALEDLKTEAKGYADLIAFEQKALALQSGAATADDVDRKSTTPVLKSHGDQLVEANGFQDFAAAIGRKQRGSFSVATKAYEGDGAYVPSGNAEVFAGTAGAFIVPQALPGYVDLRVRPLTVENVLPAGSLSSPVLWYVIETVRTNNAAATAEGALKPQGTFDFERRQEVVSKIAEIFKLADEVLTDASQLRTYVNQRLINDLGQVAQTEILTGDGTGNHLLGLNNRTGYEPTVVAGSLGADSSAWATGILRQITQVRTLGFDEPNAIFINPLDWEVLQNQTDANGQYYNGGPYGRAYGQSSPNVATFWGLKMVSTLGQPQGTALVGNFDVATVWNYQGITMDMSNSNNDDFEKDLITVRGERRLGLSLTRPLSIGKVTLTP